MPVNQFDLQQGAPLDIAQAQIHEAEMQQDFNQYGKYMNAPDASTRAIIKDEQRRYEGADRKLIDEVMGMQDSPYGDYMMKEYGEKINALVQKITEKGGRFEKDDPLLIELEKILNDPNMRRDIHKYKRASEGWKKFQQDLDDPEKGINKKLYEGMLNKQYAWRKNEKTGEVEWSTGRRRKLLDAAGKAKVGDDGQEMYEDIYSSNINAPEIIADTLDRNSKDYFFRNVKAENKSNMGQLKNLYEGELRGITNNNKFNKLAIEKIVDDSSIPENIKQNLLVMFQQGISGDAEASAQLRKIITGTKGLNNFYQQGMQNFMNENFKEKEDHSTKIENKIIMPNMFDRGNTEVATANQYKNQLAYDWQQAVQKGQKSFKDSGIDYIKHHYFEGGQNSSVKIEASGGTFSKMYDGPENLVKMTDKKNVIGIQGKKSAEGRKFQEFLNKIPLYADPANFRVNAKNLTRTAPVYVTQEQMKKHGLDVSTLEKNGNIQRVGYGKRNGVEQYYYKTNPAFQGLTNLEQNQIVMPNQDKTSNMKEILYNQAY